jgi:hypothetical protein
VPDHRLRSSAVRSSVLGGRTATGRLLGLALAAGLLGLGTGAPAVLAQPDGTARAEGTAPTGDQLFGGYSLTARANPVQLTYDSPGLFPVSPIFQLSIPEALATLSSGPSGYALASLAFPGPLVADLGTVIALAAEEAPDIPGYPIRQEAFFPAGPTEAEQGNEDGTVMRAVTDATSSTALARYGGLVAPPVVTAGNVVSHSRSSIEDGRAVTRARAEITDLSVLGGILTIESVVTDLVAVNNGEEAASDGDTVVSGVRFLGLAATLDERGLLLAEVPVADEGPLAGLPGVGPAAEALSPATAPLNDLLQGVLDQGAPSLNGLLEQAGISVAVLDPTEEIADGSVTRSAAGLQIDVRYVGRDQQGLNDLVNALPPDLRQSLGPLPNPVNLLVETHLMTLAVGTASVSSTASPLFEMGPLPFEPPSGTALGPLPPAPPAMGADGADFTASLPDVAPAGPRSSPQGGQDQALARQVSHLASVAVPALLVIALVMGAPLFGAAGSRLADNVLAPVTRCCPQGLDRPPDPPAGQTA